MSERHFYLGDGTVQGRYERDAAFRHLVDTLHCLVRDAQFTPTEIREAAILAQTHYEALRCEPRWWIPLRPLDEKR